jgi:peroxiredoxin/rhodanese-related sulfurtransferase
MKSVRWILTIAVIAVALFLLSSQERAVAIPVGEEAPDFTLETHDGKSLTLSRLEGKRGAVLVFFATWCPPCMAEVPHVKAFVEEVRDEPVLVYAINSSEPLSTVKRFVEAREINYRVLMDKGGRVARTYSVYAIPAIVGIDGEGVVRYVGHGIPRNTEEFVELLSRGVSSDDESDAAREAETAESPSEAAGTDRVEDGVSFISRDTLVRWLGEDAAVQQEGGESKLMVINVLSREQYRKQHIPGSVNIPLGEIEAKAGKLDKNRRIVTYCYDTTCRASTEAAQLLKTLGFEDVHDYEGGIMEWKEAGRDVATEAAE